MKTRIAKDNDFNTIGIEVTSKDNNVLFQWGVSPMEQFHFVKEVSVDEFEIIELVKLQTKLQDLERFVSRFFDICKENDYYKKDKNGKVLGVKFGSIDNEISNLKRMIATRIQKFI